MKPKKQETIKQTNLFSARLDQILNRKHPLFVLAGQINWDSFDEEFGKLYSENGRPGLPTRMMVGLHYLKHTFNESDESIVERFVENPYHQYFCGFEYFQHRFPIDPSSMTRWRDRIGSEGMMKLVQETIETAKRRGDLTNKECERVNVDTTVQEKAIAYPTDSRLYQKARVKLVKMAKARGIELRQTYVRIGDRAFKQHGRYAHARQFKRARKLERKLRTYLGRVIRDVERKCSNPDNKLIQFLTIAQVIYEQKKTDSPKVYSAHALEVECISKGKAHKRYEFGCKTSVVSTSENNWILSAAALHGNPYDGHTLKQSLESAQATSRVAVKQTFVDKGYKGAAKDIPEIKVYMSGQRGLSREQKKWLRRRQAIEPVIGHLKSDYRMGRNFLHGYEGDRINAILAAAAFNFAKLFRAAALFIQIFIFQSLIEMFRHQKAARFSTTAAVNVSAPSFMF